MNYKGLIILILMVAYQPVKADLGDTIIYIDEVVATGVRFDNYSTGASLTTIDSTLISTYQTATLTDLLNDQSLVSIKSYGPGGLATMSIRGGSDKHSVAVWNGFVLKNPMNGGLNYSTIPSGFFTDITVQNGGSSTMYGNGASTGVIFLSSKINIDESGFFGSAHVGYGSFNQYSAIADIGYSNEKLAVKSKSSYSSAENNFKYESQEFGKPTKRLDHAAFEQYSFLNQFALRVKNKTQVEGNLWYTETWKQAPSMVTDMLPGTSEQSDKSLKISLSTSTYFSNGWIKIRSGYLTDQNIFLDKDTMAYTQYGNNKAISFINEAETRIEIYRNLELFFGLNYTNEKSKSEAYLQDPVRNRFSFFGRYNMNFFDQRLKFSLEGRQEFSDTEAIPFVFAFGSDFKLLKGLSIKGNISKHYSLPTMNDLFWGEDAFSKSNPNVKPENGWNFESGLSHTFRSNSFAMSNEVNFYYLTVNDWIVWLPDFTTKYTPVNKEKFKSQGIEVNGNYKYFADLLEVGINYAYAFTNAFIGESIDDVVQYKPKTYVPKHKVLLGFNAKWKNYSLQYSNTYLSEREIDETSNPLESFLLANITVGKTFFCHSSKIFLSASAKNLYNTEYQLSAGYAQPLRNYSINININF